MKLMEKQKSFFWIGLFFSSLIIISSVNAQNIGGKTQEILENSASNNKPQQIKLEQNFFWQLFGVMGGEADYTQRAKINQTTLTSDKQRNLITQLWEFIFHTSSNKQSGFIPANLPQQLNEQNKTVNSGTGNEAVEMNFKNYYCASVPNSVCLAQNQAAVSPQPSTSLSTSPTSSPVTALASNSVLEAGEKIMAIAGDPANCGWIRVDHQTKKIVSTLTGSSGPTQSFSTCLEPVKNLSSLAYIYLKHSADTQDWLQCVGFVNGATTLSGAEIRQPGHAKTYCSGNFSGYEKLIGVTPQPGDVAIDVKIGYTGHIYIVKEIRGSTVLKLEANNYRSDGTITNDSFVNTDTISCLWRKK